MSDAICIVSDGKRRRAPIYFNYDRSVSIDSELPIPALVCKFAEDEKQATLTKDIEFKTFNLSFGHKDDESVVVVKFAAPVFKPLASLLANRMTELLRPPLAKGNKIKGCGKAGNGKVSGGELRYGSKAYAVSHPKKDQRERGPPANDTAASKKKVAVSNKHLLR